MFPNMNVDDGVTVSEAALSLMTYSEEYIAVLLRNIDALSKHYSHLYVQKWRFLRHCVWQRALGKIATELHAGRDKKVTSVVKNDTGRKTKAKMWRWTSLPCFIMSLVMAHRPHPLSQTIAKQLGIL